MEDLIFRVVSGAATHEDVQSAATAQGISKDDVYNAVAVAVARRVLADTMTFEDGDGALNNLFALMVSEPVASEPELPLPQPAYAIYEAFDSGEYDLGEGVDPVEGRTKPQLRRILGEDADGVG